MSKISYLVFEGTTQLETLRIPSYTIVDNEAFSGAEALHTIYGVKGSNAETVAKAVGLNFVPVKDISVKLNKTKLMLYTMKGKNTAMAHLPRPGPVRISVLFRSIQVGRLLRRSLVQLM